MGIVERSLWLSKRSNLKETSSHLTRVNYFCCYTAGSGTFLTELSLSLAESFHIVNLLRIFQIATPRQRCLISDNFWNWTENTITHV